MKKRIISMAFVLTLAIVFAGVPAAAKEDAALSGEVYVSVSNAGELVLAAKSIAVKDVDGNGLLTAYDALYCAHEAAYPGGAKAGFAAADGGFGMAITCLWGNENGGSYGYYLNDQSIMNLDTEVKTGDHLYAYSYADLTAWSDEYGHFDVLTVEGKENDTVTLTLMAEGFDENWMPVSTPVSGAVILIDGKATAIKTDADGKAAVTLSEKGTHVISAGIVDRTLTPPVCIATVSQAGANWVLIGVVLVTFAAIVATALLIAGRRKNARK